MPIEPLTPETASEYDFIVLLDASGSMGFPSTKPGLSRWNEAQEIIFSIAAGLEEYDTDGIDVITFGATTKLHEGVTSAKVIEVFTLVKPLGSTPLHEAIQIVVDKQKATGKKTVALVFTDGRPDREDIVTDIITRAANSLNADEDLTFLFVQIGNDPQATAFLNHLDDGINAKFDIVDALPVEEAGKYEPLALITKAIND